MGLLRHEAFFDGKPTNYWVRALKQERFLGHAPPGGDIGKTLREGGAAAVPVLREIVTDPDENARAEALRALSFLGPEAREATPELAATMKQENNSGRFMLASEALAKADPTAAAETHSAILRDKTNNSRRSWALTELLKIAPQGQEALAPLQDIVNDPKEDVLLRVQAIRMLWRLKQPSEPLVVDLSAVVTSDRSPAGNQALEVLGEMGPAAKPAVPTLLKLLESPNLPLIGPRWGPPHQVAIIHALGMIGPEARAAVPRLQPYLKSENDVIRRAATQALEQIGS